MSEITFESVTKEQCCTHLRPVRDVMDLLNGKWKIPILVVLHTGSRRFNELKDEIDGISAKMLSKELSELEINELVKREVRDTKPITVEYSITDYGKTLDGVISELSKWGQNHRDRIMK
ncbi:winged helix-turn-helix transcriptional regulator [Rhodohalobacter sp. 614A]|uniref:winged helix-turn-helix transcriptional regulator n=1 Tax=Rhodohalobacter sp. 614A TaxID=2908649 RepID=UPI001F28AE32|nr:helix-turn-helix domain-containing protein [Rhodohalobacter sp. 614A]